MTSQLANPSTGHVPGARHSAGSGASSSCGRGIALLAVCASWAVAFEPAAVAAPRPRAAEATTARFVPTPPVAVGLSFPACARGSVEETEPPAYYAIELVPTGRVPTARRATGIGAVQFSRSPFGIAVSPGGEYVYDLEIRVQDIAPPPDGAYVAWVTTPQLDQVVWLGALDAEYRAQGEVTWNKFLVVVTLEPSAEPAEIWQGPVVVRGMSRSGRMHTMAGHGPFQAEPCAKYGY